MYACLHREWQACPYTGRAMNTAQTFSRTTPLRLGPKLQAAGHHTLRYGLAVILLLIGLQKWTKAEAEAIQPWMAHSPLLSWLYHVTTVQGASIFVGVCELIIAALIAVRRWSPRLSAAGSAGAILTFVTTLSFLFTTPNQGPDAQGFLIKDLFLLGASIWSAGEALDAADTGTHKASV